MIRYLIALLLIACSGHAFAASNCITSGNTSSYTYFVAVDSTDKVTRETGLSSFTVYRSRNGGTATAFTTPTVNETSSSNMPGVYELLLDEDTTVSGDSVEHMALHITHAGMEPVTKEICIAPAASGISDADLGIAASGTAQAGTSSTIQLASATSFADDALIGATVMLVSGTGAGQSRVVTDWVSSTDTATVAPNWTTNPSSDSVYNVFGTAPSSGGGGLDAAGVRSAIGLASANLDTQLSGIQGDTDNIQTRIPAALVSGRMDSSVGAMASNTLTATAIASDAITAAKIASDVGTEIGTATWGIGTRTLTAGTNIVLAKGTGVTGFNDPDASAIADAVWDEARAGHTTSGTFGYYLDSAISGVSTGGVSVSDIADAVWDEALSGHVAAGSAGERLSRIPNAAAGGNGGLPTVNASNQVAGVSGNVVGTVNGLTATAQDNVRTALGMSSANLDTQLSGLSSAIAVIDGIVDQLLIGVNVAEINGVEIIGDGSGTPFGVAP